MKRLLVVSLIVLTLLIGLYFFNRYWIHRYDGLIARQAGIYRLDPDLVWSIIYEQYRDVPDPEPRVVAAYNAGRSRAADWSKVSVGARQLSGDEFINKIEISSTRAYVISILGRYRKLKGPAQTAVTSPTSSSPASGR